MTSGEILGELFLGAVALAFWIWWWMRAAVKREARKAFREEVKAGLWADTESTRDEEDEQRDREEGTGAG